LLATAAILILLSNPTDGVFARMDEGGVKGGRPYIALEKLVRALLL